MCEKMLDHLEESLVTDPAIAAAKWLAFDFQCVEESN